LVERRGKTKILQTIIIAEVIDFSILKKGKAHFDGVLAKWDNFLF
jgi:hypothetical protein